MISINPVTALDSEYKGILSVCISGWRNEFIFASHSQQKWFLRRIIFISHLLLGRCHKSFFSPISHLGDGPKIYNLPSPTWEMDQKSTISHLPYLPSTFAVSQSPTGRYQKDFPSPISHLGDWKNWCHLPSPQPLSPLCVMLPNIGFSCYVYIFKKTDEEFFGTKYAYTQNRPPTIDFGYLKGRKFCG